MCVLHLLPSCAVKFSAVVMKFNPISHKIRGSQVTSCSTSRWIILRKYFGIPAVGYWQLPKPGWEVFLLENFLNWRNLLVFGGRLISHSQKKKKKINSVKMQTKFKMRQNVSLELFWIPSHFQHISPGSWINPMFRQR